MTTFALIGVNSLLLACSQGGSSLEQMEAEIARIVEQVRPAVVRVSVKRPPRMRLGWSPEVKWLFPDLKPRLFDSARKMTEETMETLERTKEKIEELRGHYEEAKKKYDELAPEAPMEPETPEPPEVVFVPPALGVDVSLPPKSRSIGSGISIGGGYVLTTHTVAGGGEEIAVTLADGREVEGKLVGSDEATDIALIQLKEENVPSVRLGDSSKAGVGSIGIFLSRSYGRLDNVNFGFVTGRDKEGSGGEMLRLNFPILPGESGAPLLSSRGEVIGIASANLRRNFGTVNVPTTNEDGAFSIYTGAYTTLAGAESSKEFSYFIPAERVKGILEDLKQFGEVRRAWLGVSGSDTTLRISDSEKIRGVLVEKVEKGSAAEAGGLAVGDILIRCGGEEIPNFAALRRHIERLPVGKAVEVAVRRGGKETALQVVPQARPDAKKAPKGGGADLGMTLVPKSKELTEYLGLEDSPDGRVVASVERGGLAERAGIRKGDLILGEAKRPGDSLKVWRGGQTIELELPKK